MTLTNVVTDTPNGVSLISSDANLTISGVNLPIMPSASARVTVNGTATQAVDPSNVLDCSKAYVDFPTLTNPSGTSW